ncbi:MAG TPA: hypothetical protein DCQ50_16760 [Chryseobacterium sp.]|nr:hypothetical protein [Chryseobacterium sp.]
MEQECKIRNKRVELRFTEAEYQVVKEKARKADLPVAVYLREAGLSKVLKEMLTPELRKILNTDYRILAGIRNNLNQITKAMHQEGFGKHAPSVVGIINKIDKTLDLWT